MATKKVLKDLSNFKFVNTEGKEISLDKFFNEDDYWEKKGYVRDKKTGKRKKETLQTYIKHPAIKRLRQEAGITMSAVTMMVQPTASNEQQHLIKANFLSGTIGKVTTEVGEASIRNTGIGVSRNYLGTMAFKRLHDRGVLDHLGFYNLYSEEEADDFQEEKTLPIKAGELKELKPFLDKISLSETVQELDEVKREIVKLKQTFGSAQLNYLRDIYKKKLVELELAEDPLEEETVKETTPESSSDVEPADSKPSIKEEPKKELSTVEKIAQEANEELKKDALGGEEIL